MGVSGMRKRFILSALAACSLGMGVLLAPTAGLAKDAGAAYDSIPSPLPGNLPSVGFEATSTSEFGNQITFGHGSRNLHQVAVTMSSWACQSGTWGDGTCVSAPGSTFPEDITLNLYNAPTGASAPGPGSLITTMTEKFNIPYRPSATIACATGGWGPSCFHGLATNIVFDFDLRSGHIKLPDSVVYGIAYNTSDYGAAPQRPQACNATTQGCPYDSLNVALSTDPTDVSAGSNPNSGTVFWSTSFAPFYCDGGTNGSGFFRLDSPGAGNACWGVAFQNGTSTTSSSPFYVPAVEFWN
jgi:hypothetical protein